MATTNGSVQIQRSSPLDPENMTQAIQLCERIATSGLVPDSLRGKPNDLLVVLLTGRDLDLSVAESMRAIYVVKGRPSLSTSFKLARAQQHPDCEYIQLVESTPQRATWEAKRKGQPHPTRITWTIEQAQKAGLAGKGTWASFPDAMLRWRAASALVDSVFPDAAFGLLPSVEEVRDYEEDPLPREVNPPPVPPAAEAPTITDAEVATPEEDPATKARTWIAAAKTAADLADVGALIADLPKGARDAVRGDYAARLAEVIKP